jgi:hypothetical protein
VLARPTLVACKLHDVRSMKRTTSFLLLLSVCAGCDQAESVDGTQGELGRVSFTYSQGCFFGCPLDQPLLTGTRQAINVTGPGDDEGVAAESSDRDVVDFALERSCFCERKDDSRVHVEIAVDAKCQAIYQKHCDNTLRVQAVAQGDATLTLTDARGDTLDRVPVLVHDVDRASFFVTYPDRLGQVEEEAVTLGVGDKVAVEVELYDEAGRKLLAPEGVTWRVADAHMAAVSGFLTGSHNEVKAGLGIDLEALAPGETDLSLDVPGSKVALPLHVRD